MFTKTVSKNAKKALELLGKSHLLDEAYLGGGTACTLQLGHRISADLDFFTQDEFDTKTLIKSLQKISHFTVDEISWGTILGNIEGIRFSLFLYKYPTLFPYKSIFGINMLDLRDISAMKIDTIASRGKKRDFIDLYFICQSGITLEKAFLFYYQKFGELSSNIIHIRKSLVYFVDAEIEQMPKMIKNISWENVKNFFIEEVRKLSER